MLMRKRKLLISLLIILMSFTGCSSSAPSAAPDTESFYHVRIFPDQEAAEEEIPAALSLLEDRLTYFIGDYQYKQVSTDEYMDLYLPLEALGGLDINTVLREYLTRPLELFFYSSELGIGNSLVPVARENLESVTLETEPLENIDPLDYGVNEKDYSYIKIVFTESFAEEQEETIAAYGENLNFIQDPDMDWVKIGKTIPESDGRTFYLLSNVDSHFLECKVHNWNQPSLPFAFSFQTWRPVIWENPTEIENAGTHQCLEEELSGNTILMIFTPSDSYCPEEDWNEILKITKTRLDAFDTPYAIGHQADLPQSLAIRTYPGRIGDATLPLLDSTAPFALTAGTCKYDLTWGEGTLTYDPEAGQGGALILDLSKVNKEAFYQLSSHLADLGGGELALTWNRLPIYSTWLDTPITDGILIFDQDCHDNETDLSLSENWLLCLLETVYQTDALPMGLSLQFAGGYDEEDNIILPDFYHPSYEPRLSYYQNQISDAYPDSEFSILDTGTLYLQLHLPMDEKLPETTAAAISDICQRIHFLSTPFDSLTVCPIDTMTGETAEIYCYKDYFSHKIMVSGTISGGRLSEQSDLWQTAVEQIPFYAESTDSYLSWIIN